MGRWERGGIVDNDFKWIVGPKIGPPPMPNDSGKITFLNVIVDHIFNTFIKRLRRSQNSPLQTGSACYVAASQLTL